MATSILPTASQIASAQAHLERRADWRIVRIDGVRYIKMTSGRSGSVYTVRADGKGCSCKWYTTGHAICAHMLAAQEANSRDALEAFLSAPAAPKPRPSYSALFPPTCEARGCTDDQAGNGQPYCKRHQLSEVF